MLAWLRDRLAVLRNRGGTPRSANGASSFHLVWSMPVAEVAEVSARLVIVEPPVVDRLYFWALQVSFGPGEGAHVGLQWLPGGKRAVNWGGYEPGGRELSGSPAGNTHPFPWQVGVPYELKVRRGPTGWIGSVDGWSRELFAVGTSLRDPMVWSEVFARCDDPSVRVRWDRFRAVTDDGVEVVPTSVRVSYQSVGNGGCANTDVVVDGDGFVQVTSVPRLVPPDTYLQVEP